MTSLLCLSLQGLKTSPRVRPRCPPLRTGSAANVAPTPSHQVGVLSVPTDTHSARFTLLTPTCRLSATYQKIKPTPHPPGGRGASNYSVTLVVGDTSSDGTSSTGRRLQQPLTAAGWQQDAALRSFASLPRPQNKSVLKKFFGRKDV